MQILFILELNLHDLSNDPTLGKLGVGLHLGFNKLIYSKIRLSGIVND